MTSRFDMSQVEKEALRLGAVADQLPFIMSLSLNRALKDTRQHLIGETWPKSITQRNAAFIRRALRTEFATKRNLQGAIFDDLGRASLKKHAEGGTKLPRKATLAVPSRNIRVGSHGVVKSQRPRNLPTNKTFVKDGKIFQATGKGKRRKLKVMYFLKPSVKIPKDVPFYEDFHSTMRASILRNLPGAVKQAMATRR